MNPVQRHELKIVATLVPDQTTVIIDSPKSGFQYKHFYVGSVASLRCATGKIRSRQ